jgi:ribonuclease Z
MTTRNYICQKRFIPEQEDIKHPFDGLLLKEPALSVSAEILDHSIPCLGFTIEERFHVNIIKERVVGLGLEIGPWLNEFKQALYNNIDPDSEFEVKYDRKDSYKKRFILGDLAKRIAIITPGQKVSYIVDAVYSKSNEAKIIELAKNADHLFIEAPFLEKDRDIAEKKCHLTAWQAGRIAGKAGVKQVTPFHFSPRYKGLKQLLEKEAMDSYHRHISRR